MGNSKKLNTEDKATDAAGADQSIFAIAILEKIKEIRAKFSQGSVTALEKIVSYQEAGVKLKNTLINQNLLQKQDRNNIKIK